MAIELNRGLLFHQLFEPETSTYTYLIGDEISNEAVIIDPVLEMVERDLKLIAEVGYKLKYILDTHIHADHITAADEIRKRTQAKTAVSVDAEVPSVDIPLADGQVLFLGSLKIKIISTPGHTNTCISYLIENMIFTGDALLVRGCGRTDFQQGSSDKLYDSVHGKLYALPDSTIVYPGHDYRGHTSSTIGQEKKYNPRLSLTKSKTDFNAIMAELKLANPKKIHEAVPANLASGSLQEARTFSPEIVNGVPSISCESVFSKINQIKIIDVRRSEEFMGELGHIPGALLISLGPSLTRYLENSDRSDEIVFVCRSGARSHTATAESVVLGYKFTSNMAGGMLAWNDKKLSIEKK